MLSSSMKIVFMKRKSWRMIPKAGNIGNLQLVEEEIEHPKENEVQVKVKAIGLNFADIFAMYGLYSATPEGSFIPGLEYSGLVERVGKRVKRFKEGDKIMGVTRFGGYTSRLNIDHNYITELPATWSFQEGASYLVQAMTAYWALIELANMKKGETVLIHSAAGGVGLWANKIVKKMGGYSIGSIGSASKVQLLLDQGYDDYVIRSRTFRSDLKNKLNGRPLDIVLECIGGHIFMDSYLNMARQGRMVVYGSARYTQTGDKPNYLKLAWKYLQRPKLDPQKMIEENKAVFGFNLIHLYDKKEKLHEMLNALKGFDLGKSVISHEFAFEDLKQAIRLFQTGKTVGKLVVRVG